MAHRLLTGQILALLAVLTAAPPVAAVEREEGTLSINFENDLFYDTDRNYTNGVRAAWLSSPEGTPDWVLRAARLFPLFPRDGTVRSSYAIGQNMYTPKDITAPDPPRSDRPYAGWLYGTIGVIAETDERLDQLGLTIGMVGPASLARQTQTLIHSIVGADRPQGWASQLRNEPGIVLTYQRSWRQAISETLVFGLPFDVTPHAGGAIGNIYTYGDAGVTFRLGDNLSLDYGPPRIEPAPPGSEYFVPQGFGWYLFAGLEGRAVLRNIFLDGNSFRHSRSVDKKPLIADFQFGGAIIWGKVRLSYTHVLRTHEFDGQTGGDNFGSFNVSVRF
jgi:hypothetical protein